MGNRKSWPQLLADRFEAVGWEVKLGSGGHYKVRRPDGQSMSWPQSPSGNRTQDNKIAEARRFGLHLAEQELDELRELDRLARIERDRLANGVPETKFVPPYKEIEAKLTEAVYAIPTPEPIPQKEDKEMPATTKYGFIEVQGVRLGIAEVAKPVMHRHNRGGDPRPLDFARELLLVDNSIRYQCLKLLASGGVCARHFETSGGLVVHWARGSHADAEPAPKEGVDLSKLEILTDTKPVAERTYPAPEPKKVDADDLVVPTGLVAQAVFQVERLRKLEDQLDELADAAGSIAGHLEALIEKLPEELVSPELQEKAEKFDRMMGALGQ